MQQSVWQDASRPSSLADSPLSLVPPLPAQSAAATANDHSLILNDTYFSQTVLTLTTGFFLSGFSVELGAPTLVIGLLLAIPNLSQLLQLPGVYLIEKLQCRRSITFWGTLMSRLLLLPVAFITLLPAKGIAIPGLTLIYILSSSLAAIANCAWNSWLKDVIPAATLGNFFSRKLSLAGFVNSGLTLAGGYFLELWTHGLSMPGLMGYNALFLFGILIGLLGIAPLRQMSEVRPLRPEQPAPAPGAECQSGRLSGMMTSQFAAPFQDTNYRRMIRFIFLWNFSMNLAVPFFTVYMLSVLGASMWMATLLTLIGQVANFLSLKTWGKLADRFSNKSVLAICAPALLLCTLCWIVLPLLDKSPIVWPTIVLVQVLLGCSMAGTTLANNNIAMKLAPEETATACIAANTMTASLALGLSPLLGGLLMDLFKRWHTNLTLPKGFGLPTFVSVDFWSVLFLIAFGLGLISLFYLTRVDEHGHVKKRVVLRALLTLGEAA